jgi:hypothetical protein
MVSKVSPCSTVRVLFEMIVPMLRLTSKDETTNYSRLLTGSVFAGLASHLSLQQGLLVVALADMAAASIADWVLVSIVALELVPIVDLGPAPSAGMAVDYIAVLLGRHRVGSARSVAVHKQCRSLHSDPCHH